MPIAEKVPPKFSGLRWFLVFEDLYNGEGSLQANKTSKKHQNLNLETVSNLKATANLFNLFSFKKKKSRRAAINQKNFIFITLHKNMIIQ